MAGYRKLGRTSSQRKALLRNQVTALLNNGRIVTTEAKAKEVRRIAESMIALAVKEKDNYDTVTVTAKVPQKDKDEILKYLMDNRFVNDERFAKCFVKGKIHQSGWGLNKIRFHLLQKGVAKELIDEALQTFDAEAYRQRLIEVLTTKAKTVKAANEFEKKRKLAAYAVQKGFEAPLVWEVLNADLSH